MCYLSFCEKQKLKKSDDKEKRKRRKDMEYEIVTLEEKIVKGISARTNNTSPDMGKVIGKQGRVAKAIRSLIKAIAAKEQKRVTVEFIG